MINEYRPPTPTEVQAAQNMEQLRDNPYPGRGIVMGFNESGELAVQVYWVMGRSENSRNRILAQDGELIKTEPFDASKVKDPSLIIYTAMREVDGRHIVSNGDQTDSVADAIEDGHSFEEGLSVRTHEPDAPNFTQRITSMFSEWRGSFQFSSIRKNPDGSTEPVRSLYQPSSTKGIGSCFHTYKGDGDPLPSFDQEPYRVLLKGTIDDIAQTYWDLLNKENRVALVAKSIHVDTGETDFRIINQLTAKTPTE